LLPPKDKPRKARRSKASTVVEQAEVMGIGADTVRRVLTEQDEAPVVAPTPGPGPKLEP